MEGTIVDVTNTGIVPFDPYTQTHMIHGLWTIR